MHAQLRQRRSIAGGVNRRLLVVAVLAVAVALRIWFALHQWSSAPALSDNFAMPAAPAMHTADVPAVQALALFGGAKSGSAAAAAANLAVSGLDLGLEGVVLAVPRANSVALITSGGRQRSYRIGDALPVGNGATVTAMEADHVVIRNDGMEQVLWLYDKDKAPGKGQNKPAVTTTSTTTGTAPMLNAKTAALVQAAPQQIRKAAARLAEIIEVAPAVSNGHLIGYMVSPGSRLKDFVQLGFKQNDVLTSANGIALTDMANLPELYNLMNRPTDVSFSLLRDGQPLTLQMTLAP